MIFFAFSLFMLFSFSTLALDCNGERGILKNIIYTQYNIPKMRSITDNVIMALTKDEHQQLLDFSNIFNSIEHDTTDHQNDRYVLQDKAKKITRTAVRRAGYQIINPESGDPFDAELFEVNSNDGYLDHIVEVSELLVYTVPLPHVTLWMYRRDPINNPYKIIYFKVKSDPNDDILMWWLPDFSDKRKGSFDQFINSFLPVYCQ
jgi:hypothetical protein